MGGRRLYHGGWRLLGIILCLGVYTVNTQFTVDLSITPSKPKPEDKLLLSCTYDLTHAQTEQLIFYDNNGITLCLFPIRTGDPKRCTAQYENLVSNLMYDSSRPGQASLVYQLQPCNELLRFRCIVTNVGAEEVTGISAFEVRNVPQPTIYCADPCTYIDGDTIEFEENGSRGLICSVSEATPIFNLIWSPPYKNVSSSLIENSTSCTYDATTTGEPMDKLMDGDQQVTCTVTAEDGTTNERTVTITSGAQRTYVMTIVVQSLWMDSLSKANCDLDFMRIVCQQVQIDIGRSPNLDIDISLLGTAPTMKDNVTMLFTASLTVTQKHELMTTLQQTVQDGAIESTSVSPNVDVRLLSDLGINVRPLSGPRAGGTLVTIIGLSQPGNQLLVNFGPIPCPIIIQTRVLSICNTTGLTDNTLVNMGLNITLQNSYQIIPTAAVFVYKPDPTITSVQPLSTILDGGVLLTVFGSYLNIPKLRVMRTTVTARETDKQITYQTLCSGTLHDRMCCPTPPIVLSDVLGSQRRRRDFPSDSSFESNLKPRRKRHTAGTLNEERNINVELGFQLDGVLNLPEDSELNVFTNPVITGFDPPSPSKTFTSTWPIGDTYLEIKGERLLGGIAESGYTVMVGLANCTNTIVQTNLIVCEPPKSRPKIAPEENVGFNRIPVKVLYADKVVDIGYLNYVQNIWEYPPGRYGIIGAICGLVLIITLLILCICYKCQQSGNNPQNLVHCVKRRNRRIRNSAGTISDINLTPNRHQEGQYRESYPSYYNDPAPDLRGSKDT